MRRINTAFYLKKGQKKSEQHLRIIEHVANDMENYYVFLTDVHQYRGITQGFKKVCVIHRGHDEQDLVEDMYNICLIDAAENDRYSPTVGGEEFEYVAFLLQHTHEYVNDNNLVEDEEEIFVEDARKFIL